MSVPTQAPASPALTLPDVPARQLMTPNPVSIAQDATVREAVEMLTGRAISGAPVIDEAGRPVGVVTRADILTYDRQSVDYAAPLAHAPAHPAEPRVRDIMTPVVFCVAPDAPASRVVREMLDLKIHRLFVVEDPGTLVGVITVLDILRHLTP